MTEEILIVGKVCLMVYWCLAIFFFFSSFYFGWAKEPSPKRHLLLDIFTMDEYLNSSFFSFRVVLDWYMNEGQFPHGRPTNCIIICSFTVQKKQEFYFHMTHHAASESQLGGVGPFAVRLCGNARDMTGTRPPMWKLALKN